MNSLHIRTVSALVAIVAAIGMTPEAGAQYGGGPGGTGGRGGMGGMGGPGGGKGGSPQDGMQRGPMPDAPLNAGAVVQIELDRLEDELKMTPAQLDAWRLYADKVQKLADDVARSRADARSAASASANAVQRLEQIAGTSGNRASVLDEIAVAGRALYSTLNADQKAIADRRLWMPVSLLATGVMPSGMSDQVRSARRSPN